MKTSKQIAKKLKLTESGVTYRFRNQNIKGIRKGKQIFYTKQQISLIERQKFYSWGLPNYSNPKYKDDSFLIIRYYMEDFKYSEIADLVCVNIAFVHNIIKTFKNNNDFIILQSKINNPLFK